MVRGNIFVCSQLSKEEMFEFGQELTDLFMNYDICSGCVTTESCLSNRVLNFITEHY